MTDIKLARINELAKISKERDLTAEELAERDALRKEYIKGFRQGLENTLSNTYIMDAQGNKVKVTKKEDK